MKKRFLIILSFVFIITFAAGLVACGNDSDGVIEVAEVSLDRTQITLTVGENTSLSATVTPTDAENQAVRWSSSNRSVAVVENGDVYALGEGETVITVSSINGKTATCSVRVEPLRQEPPVQYPVTFYANGGSFNDDAVTFTLTLDDGSKLPEVTVTRGEKYAFTGWYKSEARTQLWDFEKDTVTEDTKIYAGWKYENDYQSVIDALTDRIKTERKDGSTEVEILSLFKNGGGYLCFVEKDGSGVFSYSTAIGGFTEIKDNAEIISEISTTDLTLIKNYNDAYTSANNAYIADCMAYKYTDAANTASAIIYSCVSEWKEDNTHYASGGPFYSCDVKALVADEYGNVFDCSFTVVAAVKDFGSVIGGSALSRDFDKSVTKLGETAADFYSEYIKAKEA